MTSILRCGIIGCGVIAPLHIESFQRLADAEVAWVCDVVEAKARSLAEKYGVPRVAVDYRTVLADPDVDCVALCTPHATHAPIALAALAAGKHVIIVTGTVASIELTPFVGQIENIYRQWRQAVDDLNRLKARMEAKR